MNKVLIALFALVFGFFVQYNFKVVEHVQKACPACHSCKQDCQQGKCCVDKKCKTCEKCTCCQGCRGELCTCQLMQCKCCAECNGHLVEKKNEGN